MNPPQLLQTSMLIFEVTISPPILKILYEIGLYRPLGITNPKFLIVFLNNYFLPRGEGTSF
jgi:hypothetical protein